MKPKSLIISAMLFCTLTAMAAANGAWPKKVPQADRERVNPYVGNPHAVTAGKVVYQNNCAKCHGADANGLHGRPSLRSERVEQATDGELAWILKNGNPWKGMPSWSSLPKQQRWQVVSYLRSLLPLVNETEKGAAR